jgi:small redox-active disulfide protein 2
MIVKILGPGCKNCQNLEKATRAALADLRIDATVEKVEDYAAIAGYGVMATPGLVVDDKVLVSGRVPKPDEIKRLLVAETGRDDRDVRR